MHTKFNSTNEAINVLYTNKTSEKKDIFINRFKTLKNYFDTKTANVNQIYFYSASGRIEICGNHTDHQLGCVLAAAIETDDIAAAAKNNSQIINVFSEGQKAFSVDINELKPRKSEYGKSAGIVRGIVARFIQLGGRCGGADICIMSDVAIGSGISSSAAFEILIATIINHLFNDCYFKSESLAEIAQFSEREYFGKPCGLMDQMAVAYGGCIMIDFKNIKPIIEPISMKCITDKFDIVLVNPGGSHAKLTNEYSSIVSEMTSIANYFGKNHLMDIDENSFMSKLSEIREKVGERPILRAMHFYEENKRVIQAVHALKNNNSDEFIDIINQSGDSSALLLQNIYLDHVQNKSVALALALTKKYLSDNNKKGACRIHGGGFAGSIISFIPKEFTENYCKYMSNIFGMNSVEITHIRNYGGICLF